MKTCKCPGHGHIHVFIQHPDECPSRCTSRRVEGSLCEDQELQRFNYPAFDAIGAMGKDHTVPLVVVEYAQDVGG